MNPIFKNLYKHKKKRVRDPNLPPPPNLFSTVRDLKDTQNNLSTLSAKVNELESRLSKAESKNRYLESYVELLKNRLLKK